MVTYQNANTTTGVFTTVVRGRGGTKKVSHPSGAFVQEANIWVRGKRLPTPVGVPVFGPAGPLTDPGWQTGSYTLSLTDTLELPDYVTHLIVEWCLRRARIKENDQQAADALLKNFADELTVAKKAQRRPRIGQARVAGEGPRLFGGRIIVR